MTKQEKLDIKLLMTGIKGSLFPEQWDNAVQEFPFILQDDGDIEDDVLIKEETKLNLTGEESMRKKSNKISDLGDTIYDCVSEIESQFDVTLQLINGVAQGYEKNVGFYVRSDEAFYRPYSATDGAISFASNYDEAEYLRSLGYVSLKKLKDVDNN